MIIFEEELCSSFLLMPVHPKGDCTLRLPMSVHPKGDCISALTSLAVRLTLHLDWGNRTSNFVPRT